MRQTANAVCVFTRWLFGAPRNANTPYSLPASSVERTRKWSTLRGHSLTFRRRRALLMTETELRLIAAPAMIGLSSKPKNG